MRARDHIVSVFFFSSRRRHTRCSRDWSSDVCSSDLAKEILKGHTCIMVRNPLSSKLWSLREVEKYNKELIDKCGKGGGLILNIRLPDKGARAEFKQLVDSIKEYSRY